MSENGEAMERRIVVSDQRKNRPKKSKIEYKFKLKPGNQGYQDLLKFFYEKIGNQDFIVTHPNRQTFEPKDFDQLRNDSQLWILNDLQQELPAVVATKVHFPPHFHTITESGMYEYYDSRGIDSLVISLAELIDNSLGATKANDGLRHIEIRYFDNGSDSMVVILDNGHGMDFGQLHDWARFKYSKFQRKKRSISNDESISESEADSGILSFSSADLPLRPNNIGPHIPDPKERRARYLDSEINYFGAGGKQAIFNIGETTTMISKTKNNDIVELTLSKKKFEQKSETDLNSVYKDVIRSIPKASKREIGENPLPSDFIFNEIIKEMEETYPSFTICCIKDIRDNHQKNFKQNIESTTYWTKGLARIYHYYLHGPKGNIPGDAPKLLPPDLADIQIEIKVYNVIKNNNIETAVKHKINLKQIDDDFETQLVQNAADSFEFEVEHYDKPEIVIEGIIRYYPYLYDHETLPQLDPNQELGETASQASAKTGATETIDENELNGVNHSRVRHREVFECFWHGRLIPQDCIDFEWNKFNPKNANIKDLEDCYYRLSGALFTNHGFQVTQNKQSFMDLIKLMSQKDCLTFYRVSEKGRRTRLRTHFENDFINWIKNCHRTYDKQVLYKQYEADVSRNEFPALKKNSYANTDTYSVFNCIDWYDREWKKGHFIQTQKTKPQGLVGKINRFLVPKCVRSNSGTFMGAPGLVEIYQMPEEVYGDGKDAAKIITFKQINTKADEQAISQKLDQILDRLPDKLEITFPKSDPIEDGSQLIAGNPIPEIRVIVQNSNGEKLTSDRIPFKTSHKRLFVRLELLKIDVGEDGTEKVFVVPDINYPIAPFSKEWDYWFTKIDEFIQFVGKYRLVCECTNSSNAIEAKQFISMFANNRPLPKTSIDFTVIAGQPQTFKIVEKEVSTFMGTQFDLTLEFFDQFGNLAQIGDKAVGSPALSMDDFRCSFRRFEINRNQMFIRHIMISGILTETKTVFLEICFPSFVNKIKEQIPITLKKINIPQKTTPIKKSPVKRNSDGISPYINRINKFSISGFLKATPRATRTKNTTPRATTSRDYIHDPTPTPPKRVRSQNTEQDVVCLDTLLEDVSDEELEVLSEHSDDTILEEDVEENNPEGNEEYDAIYDLLSIGNISFNDLVLKPNEDINNRFYETEFTAYSSQWKVRARVIDEPQSQSSQSTESQSSERQLSYQIELKSEETTPMDIHYVILKGRSGLRFRPQLQNHKFNELSKESPFQTIHLYNSQQINKLLTAKVINFRVFMIRM